MEGLGFRVDPIPYVWPVAITALRDTAWKATVSRRLGMLVIICRLPTSWFGFRDGTFLAKLPQHWGALVRIVWRGVHCIPN